MSVALHPQFIIDESGEKQSVVLPLGEFEALLAQLEEEAEDYAADADSLERAIESQPSFRNWREARSEIEGGRAD